MRDTSRTSAAESEVSVCATWCGLVTAWVGACVRIVWCVCAQAWRPGFLVHRGFLRCRRARIQAPPTIYTTRYSCTKRALTVRAWTHNPYPTPYLFSPSLFLRPSVSRPISRFLSLSGPPSRSFFFYHDVARFFRSSPLLPTRKRILSFLFFFTSLWLFFSRLFFLSPPRNVTRVPLHWGTKRVHTCARTPRGREISRRGIYFCCMPALSPSSSLPFPSLLRFLLLLPRGAFISRRCLFLSIVLHERLVHVARSLSLSSENGRLRCAKARRRYLSFYTYAIYVHTHVCAYVRSWRPLGPEKMLVAEAVDVWRERNGFEMGVGFSG